MEIALVHKHYSEEHLQEVMAEMETLGAPVIRAIWSDCHALWLAVEGCHRIRAAKVLGLEVVIDDVSDCETILIEEDGCQVERSVAELLEELQDSAPKTEIVSL